MKTLTEIADKLTVRARVEDSEQIDVLALVQDAVEQHNSSWSGTDTVPLSHSFPVLLLAWIGLCKQRASNYVNQSSTKTGSGVVFGTDRDTPYYKNMQMAKELQKQYEESIKKITTDDLVPEIQIGSFVKIDAQRHVLTPRDSLRAIGSLRLEKHSQDNAEVVLKIESTLKNALGWKIFSGAALPLHKPWLKEEHECGLTELELTAEMEDEGLFQERVFSLVALPADKTFIAAGWNTQGDAIFSNELLVTVI